MTHRSSLTTRARAAGLHLAASACVAALAAAVVFLVWYPAPYAAIAGGLSLFALLVGVDVVLGPALTAVAASPNKPRAEFRRDLAIIVLVQGAAFGYGLYAIALARPVCVAFEIDRFRVVSAADIEPELLRDAPDGMRELSWFGPRLIAAVKPTDPTELMQATELGLAGFDLSMLPRNWRPIETRRAALWAAARPSAVLLARYPQAAASVAQVAAAAGQAPQDLRFLPIVSRRASGVVLMSATEARILGYLPLEGFF